MNVKLIIDNGKLIILLFFFIFISGCSEKQLNITAVEKPKEIQNQKIRFIKIGNIRNDKVNLKEKIIQKMQQTNKLIPDYFHINPKNYKSVLRGGEELKKLDKFYIKKVKIIYKNPRCIVTLYPCKKVGDKFFCKYSSPIHYSLKDFNNIQNNSYQNGNYILINNQIYKKNISCKPEFATLKCEKKEISIKAKLNIKDRQNNLIFSKKYKKTYIDNPCLNIKEIYPNDTKTYKSYLNYIQKENDLAYLIAKDFINDIAPHNVTFLAKLFDDVDVKMNSTDNKSFKNIIDEINENPQNSKNLINEMQKLSNKHPKSCVIKYDLAVMYIKIKNYKKAKNLLFNLKNCNSDIQKEKEKLINILERIYF
jgi:hypothetical protein